MIVNWKSKNSHKEYRIFRGKLIVGILKRKGWFRNAYGEYNGAMVQFISKGFLNPIITILDIEGTKKLGEIRYSRFKSEARIQYDHQTYVWEYKSKQKKEWRIISDDDFVNYTMSNTTKHEGKIEVEGIRPEVVLAGLYIYTIEKPF
jgi:hypothetical protein